MGSASALLQEAAKRPATVSVQWRTDITIGARGPGVLAIMHNGMTLASSSSSQPTPELAALRLPCWGLWQGGPHALVWSHGKGAPETTKRQSVQSPSGDIL